jgi:hypothetical protein
MSRDELRLGQTAAYEKFYAFSSLTRRFPFRGERSRLQWSIYNLFMKKGAASDRKDAVAASTEVSRVVPVPPIFPQKREWRQAVLEATGALSEIQCNDSSLLPAAHRASATDQPGQIFDDRFDERSRPASEQVARVAAR